MTPIRLSQASRSMPCSQRGSGSAASCCSHSVHPVMVSSGRACPARAVCPAECADQARWTRPAAPSTVTRAPVSIRAVALRDAHDRGDAVLAGDDRAVRVRPRPSPSPAPPAVRNSGVQPGSVDGATRTSPGSSRAPTGSRTTRAGAVTVPAEAGVPTSAPSSGAPGAGERLGLGAVGEQHPRHVPAAQLARVLLATARPTSVRAGRRRRARPRRRAGRGRRRRRGRRGGPRAASSAPTAASSSRARAISRTRWSLGASRSPTSSRTRPRANPTARARHRERRRTRATTSATARCGDPLARGEPDVRERLRGLGPAAGSWPGRRARASGCVGPPRHAEVDLGDGAVAVAAQEVARARPAGPVGRVPARNRAASAGRSPCVRSRRAVDRRRIGAHPLRQRPELQVHLGGDVVRQRAQHGVHRDVVQVRRRPDDARPRA